MSDSASKIMRSLTAIGGLSICAGGLWLVHPAAAMVFVGLAMVLGSLMAHIQNVKRKLKDGAQNGV
jgi:uncharacterized membrane protein HdeD (DUF308 family)